MFHEKTGNNPTRGIIKPDDSSDIPAGLSVIPGAQPFFLKEKTGGIFCGKYTEGINAAPYQPMAALYQGLNWL